MATDFWSSTHFKRWIIDRQALQAARSEDLKYVEDPEHLALLSIFFASLIIKLGSKLNMRQRVIATAVVFFRRFYLKSSYCETDPFIVIGACCYVAAKAEESPLHIKTVISESRNVFAEYGIRHFPTENHRLAEMEFYLVADLECDLLVFHPYRTLMSLVKLSTSPDEEPFAEAEAGELGTGIDDGPRYWGTGEGRIILNPGGLQSAWFIINDTYLSDICLLYPPHLIAITALYLACILNPNVRQAHLDWQESRQASLNAPKSSGMTRRSSRHSGAGPVSAGSSTTIPQKRPHGIEREDSDSHKSSITAPVKPQDFVEFFANLNVNMRLIATIAQEIISFYALCERLKDDANPSSTVYSGKQFPMRILTQMEGKSSTMKPISTSTAVDSTYLIQMFTRMRVMKEAELPPLSARSAINKLLERTQGAG